MQTSSIKKDEIKRDWYLVDAENKTLGRLASEVAQMIRGKNKVFFTPNLDMGDFVIVINADKISLSGNKAEQKKYLVIQVILVGIRRLLMQHLKIVCLKKLFIMRLKECCHIIN